MISAVPDKAAFQDVQALQPLFVFLSRNDDFFPHTKHDVPSQAPKAYFSSRGS